MTVRESTGLRTAMCGAKGFSSIFESGCIEVRTGSQPVSANSAATGTLLGTITQASGGFTPGSPTNGLTFDAAVNGSVSKSGVWSFVGIADGTAGWFRLKGNAIDNGEASTTMPRLDGSCATSGGDMSISNILIAVGAPCTVDVFQYIIPA